MSRHTEYRIAVEIQQRKKQSRVYFVTIYNKADTLSFCNAMIKLGASAVAAFHASTNEDVYEHPVGAAERLL